jgi:hypothetical protein
MVDVFVVDFYFILFFFQELSNERGKKAKN